MDSSLEHWDLEAHLLFPHRQDSNERKVFQVNGLKMLASILLMDNGISKSIYRCLSLENVGGFVSFSL